MIAGEWFIIDNARVACNGQWEYVVDWPCPFCSMRWNYPILSLPEGNRAMWNHITTEHVDKVRIE